MSGILAKEEIREAAAEVEFLTAATEFPPAFRIAVQDARQTIATVTRRVGSRQARFIGLNGGL
jgi:hypothetical protein